MDHSKASMSVSFTVKQVFVAGIVVGALALAALGFVYTLASGSGFSFGGGKGRAGIAPSGPSAAAPDAGSGEAVGEVAPITNDDHIRGNKNAKVALIEYSDFQCPFCSRFHPTMQQALDQYGDKIAWVYRHFPLNSIHPDAQKAAEASECASEQGKFWEMADKMFEKQASGLGVAQLSVLAKEAGVRDIKKFEACVSSGKYADVVAADQASGEKAGVTGTPGTIVIGPNGKKQLIPGALPIDSVKQIIDSMLNA